MEVFGSLHTSSRFEPGYECVDGEEGESESFLTNYDETDSLILILEDPGLSNQHQKPADDEDGGHNQFILEDPLEILHIHFNFYLLTQRN